MAFSDEDPSVRMPLPSRGNRLDESPSTKPVRISMDKLCLMPEVSCVEQFKVFFATHNMENLVRIEQEKRNIDTEDPYIKYLLAHEERIEAEIKELEAYIRNNAEILMPMHKIVLENFAVFLRRLGTYANVIKSDPRVYIPLSELPNKGEV